MYISIYIYCICIYVYAYTVIKVLVSSVIQVLGVSSRYHGKVSVVK